MQFSGLKLYIPNLPFRGTLGNNKVPFLCSHFTSFAFAVSWEHSVALKPLVVEPVLNCFGKSACLIFGGCRKMDFEGSRHFSHSLSPKYFM